MKKEKTQSLFLAQLQKLPIVQNACQIVNVSRTAVYNWRRDDPKFAKAMDEALAVGEAFMNDLTENQLVSLIQEKNFSAIALWLRNRHPKFRDKLDITARIEKKESLTPEQQEIVRKALQHAALLPKDGVPKQTES